MSSTRDAFGGELADLWAIANADFPTVRNVYNEQIAEVAPVAGSPDADRYGNCHLWWDMIAQELERAMILTGESLDKAMDAINQAVDDFAYVDGDNSKSLTDAGKGLEEYKKYEDEYAPVDIKSLPDDYEPPADNYIVPEGWDKE